MLEEIHIYGSFEREYGIPYSQYRGIESVAQSIGPLVNRTALRKLHIEIEDYRPAWDMDDRPGREDFDKFLINLFNCPGEKPNLEELVLHSEKSRIILLEPIYQFVNENKNLKSLELYGEIKVKETAISELIKILTCDNGLHEIKLHEEKKGYDGTYRTIIGDALAKKYTNGRKIKREEFSKLVEDLRNFDPKKLK